MILEDEEDEKTRRQPRHQKSLLNYVFIRISTGNYLSGTENWSRNKLGVLPFNPGNPFWNDERARQEPRGESSDYS